MYASSPYATMAEYTLMPNTRRRSLMTTNQPDEPAQKASTSPQGAQRLRLSLRDKQHLDDLHLLTDPSQLSALKLSRCEQVNDLSPLIRSTQLRELTLDKGYQVSDL